MKHETLYFSFNLTSVSFLLCIVSLRAEAEKQTKSQKKKKKGKIGDTLKSVKKVDKINVDGKIRK